MQRELGKGGMGSVYLAHDEVLGRDVAVKTIEPPPAGKSALETLRSRFMNEARAIATLSHPNVVNVFDAGVEDGTPYLVMEVVPGASLKERLAQDGPLAPSEVCALGIQIAQALQEAHDKEIVHRDVKPANILQFKSDQWKLGDFGVARVPDSSLTLTGQFLGTPAYAAPETLSEGAFGASCDVYALAATLYEAVASAPPFPRSPQLRMAAIASGEGPKPLREAAPHAPDDLAEVIAKGLEARPSARPSAAELAEALAVVSVRGTPGEHRTHATREGAGPARGEDPDPGQAETQALDSTGPPVQPELAAAPTTPAEPRGRRLGLALVLALLVAAGGGALALARLGGASSGEREGAVADQSTGAGGANQSAAPAEGAKPSESVDSAEKTESVEGAESAPMDAAPPPDASPPDAASADARPAIPELERARARVRAGRDRAALATLEDLRSRHPDVAEIPYLMGRVYFGRMWWSQGFERYQAAIEIDPDYRHDETLIADVIEALKGSRRGHARRFLINVIGEPAIPQLQKATERRDSLRISRGSRAVLKRLGAE